MTSITQPMTQHIKLPITLPGYYIAKRTNKNGYYIEQHIKLESTTTGNSGETLYTGYYGNYGYHEIYCRKEDIRPIDNALSRVNNIDGVYFTYKDSGDKSIGVIAQDIQKILPEVVSEDKNGYLGVNYSGIVPVLIEAVREQNSIISDLEDRISKLENK